MSRQVLSTTARVAAFAACATFLAGHGAAAYPDRPVKIITQGAAGSGPDVITRIVAAHLARLWGQEAVILNQSGGGGVLAARAAAQAEPDGYTLYAPTITTFVIMPELRHLCRSIWIAISPPSGSLRKRQ